MDRYLCFSQRLTSNPHFLVGGFWGYVEIFGRFLVDYGANPYTQMEKVNGITPVYWFVVIAAYLTS